MLKLFHVYKTTNLLNGKVFVGVHGTEDIFFGTGDYLDPYIGSIDSLLHDLSLQGRHTFRVHSFHAYPTEQEALAHRDRLITPQFLADPRAYNKPTQNPLILANIARKKLIETGSLTWRYSPATIEKKRQFAKENNLIQYLGQREGTIWINDGKSNLNWIKTEPIPEGFVRGLKYKPRGKKVFSPESIEKIRIAMLGNQNRRKSEIIIPDVND